MRKLNKVMLIDRAQKEYFITKEQNDYLKKDKLTEGRYPNVYICSSLAQLTDEKEKYYS